MVRTLWPALWGRAIKDVWPGGLAAWDAGEWAGRHLAPEGPFPAIRIGDQPYGVLPATALDQWVGHPSDPPIESQELRARVRRFRDLAAGVAEAEGNVAGASTERFLDLISHTPTTAHYGWEWLLPLEWVRLAWIAAGNPIPLTVLENRWNTDAAAVLAESLQPLSRHQPLGGLTAAGEPFVVRIPQRLIDGDSRRAIEALLRAAPEPLAYTTDTRWQHPMTLLARLVRHALILTNAEVRRAADALADGTLAAMSAQLLIPADATELANLAGSADVTAVPALANSGIGVAEAIARAWCGVRDGAERLLAEHQPRLSQLLNTTLDVSSHRVDPWVTGFAARRLRWLAARGARWRLGVYGWVDSPRPWDHPIPNVVPLEPGPTTAGLLHAPSPAQALTAALLRDRAIRDPLDPRWDIALTSEKIRHAKRLGEHVRQGVHIKEALGLLIEQIAGDPALVLKLRKDFPMRPEHEGRRVADGEKILEAALTAPATLPGTLASQIAPLKDAIDTYGDLLIVDAVYQLVSGRGDLAAESMEAAAGLGAPPELRALTTHRSGRSVSTVVLAAIPHAEVPSGLAPNPGRVADPSLARLLDDTIGGAGWTWSVSRHGLAPVVVSCQDLGLEPINLLAFAPGELSNALRRFAGAQAGAVVVSTGGSERLAQAGRLAALLNGSDDVPPLIDAREDRPLLTKAAADLRKRAVRLGAEAAGLRDRLRAAATRSTALGETLRWGIRVDATLAATAQAEDAAAILDTRLKSHPAPAAQDLGALRTVIRGLSGTSALPVVFSLPASDLPVLVPAASAGVPGLGESWLGTVAAVRAPLARVDAHQLGAGSSFGAAPWREWTNPEALGDPWLTDPERGNALIAAFAPGSALPSAGTPRWPFSIAGPRRFRAGAMKPRSPSASTHRNRAPRRPFCSQCLPISWRRWTPEPSSQSRRKPGCLLAREWRRRTGSRHTATRSRFRFCWPPDPPRSILRTHNERLRPAPPSRTGSPARRSAQRISRGSGRPRGFLGASGNSASIRGRTRRRRSRSPCTRLTSPSTSMRAAPTLIRPSSRRKRSSKRRSTTGGRSAGAFGWDARRRPCSLRSRRGPPPRTCERSRSASPRRRTTSSPPSWTAAQGLSLRPARGPAIWKDVPRALPDRWHTEKLGYECDFMVGPAAQRTTLQLRDHDGGDIDWYSVDGSGPAPAATVAPIAPRFVIPSRLRYPGAPHPRWWEIEDHNVDVGGFPPDRTHIATILLLDVVLAHSDDWFTFVVPSPLPADGITPPSSGVVVTLHDVKVRIRSTTRIPCRRLRRGRCSARRASTARRS